MSIEIIETEIIKVVNRITDLKAVYDYPEIDIGRNLPAMTIMYAGFATSTSVTCMTNVDYVWEFTLYLPIEGKNLKDEWGEVKSIVHLVLKEFRKDKTLNETCLSSRIVSGIPVIKLETGSTSNYIGHNFKLEVRRMEK